MPLLIQKTGSKQKGSVLVVSLLILVVLTMIGVSSMTSSSLQEQMAGNFRDRQIAFQSAEVALAYAEEHLKGIVSNSVFDNTNGYYAFKNGPTDRNAFDASWWDGTKDSLAFPDNISGVRTPPRFVIEYRGDVGSPNNTSGNFGSNYNDTSAGGELATYRITARGTGLSDKTQVIIQSYFGKLN